MPETLDAHEARFGRMRIVTTLGETVDQPVQAVIYPANSRGVMGTGAISAVRSSAGLDVEREAMSYAPIEPGTAIVTSSGRLADRGIEAIIHAVVTEQLGQRIERSTMRRAIASALRLADEHRFRTVAMPLMGISADDSVEARTQMIEAQRRRSRGPHPPVDDPHRAAHHRRPFRRRSADRRRCAGANPRASLDRTEMTDHPPENESVESSSWATPAAARSDRRPSAGFSGRSGGPRWLRPQNGIVPDDFRYRLDAMLIPPPPPSARWARCSGSTTGSAPGAGRRSGFSPNRGGTNRRATGCAPPPPGETPPCATTSPICSATTIRAPFARCAHPRCRPFRSRCPNCSSKRARCNSAGAPASCKAYLCKPEDAERPMPLVCLLNGATTTKEELLLWTAPLREAGFAVLTLDWPGTGEAAGNLKLSSQCDDITDGIYSLAVHDRDLDAAISRCMGVSIGSSVALRAAALDRRIGAVMAVSPPFEPRFWTANVPPAGSASSGGAGRAGGLAAVRACRTSACPTCCIESNARCWWSGLGRISSFRSSESMHVAASLGDLATMIWYEQSGHCAYDQIDDWMDVAAQWLFGAFGIETGEEPSPQSTQVEPPAPPAPIAPATPSMPPAEDVVISVDPAAVRRDDPIDPEDDAPDESDD